MTQLTLIGMVGWRSMGLQSAVINSRIPIGLLHLAYITQLRPIRDGWLEVNTVGSYLVKQVNNTVIDRYSFIYLFFYDIKMQPCRRHSCRDDKTCLTHAQRIQIYTYIKQSEQ